MWSFVSSKFYWNLLVLSCTKPKSNFYSSLLTRDFIIKTCKSDQNGQHSLDSKPSSYSPFFSVVVIHLWMGRAVCLIQRLLGCFLSQVKVVSFTSSSLENWWLFPECLLPEPKWNVSIVEWMRYSKLGICCDIFFVIEL